MFNRLYVLLKSRTEARGRLSAVPQRERGCRYGLFERPPRVVVVDNDARQWNQEGVSYMENNSSVKTFNGHLVPRRHFTREKEELFHTRNYLEFLAHYHAELVRTDGPIMVVRCTTGTELPLEPKAKLQMVTLLLDEFRTVDGVNKAIENYKASHA